MTGWPEVALGALCEVFSGYPFKSAHFTDDPDDVALVKGENVGQGEILWEISKRWPREDADDLARYRLQRDDIVLAMDRPWVPAGLKFARIGESDPEALVVQRVARLRATGDLDQRFLYYVIASSDFVAYVKNAARGVGVPHVSGKQIAEFRFGLPPRVAQEAIADILSAYDDLIENNKRRMALLEEAARQLYREWFVRLRFPGHEHTRITNGVPAGWKKVPFESALVLQRGFDLPVQDREDGDVPIYGSTGINGFHNKAKVVGPGIVTGRSGTLGEVRYIEGDFWPLNTALWVKEFRRVPPLFTLFLMREMDLKQFNGGASVPTLDRKTVHRTEILMPPKPLVRSFDEFAAPLFQQIGSLTAQIEKLRAARDLLLPRLMNGEIAI
ncbi:MAG: restriction endonuclease subunit S [Nitrospira sp.]|uniref:Type I restriction-modification system, specificity subunit S n=1 Tax=Nitrospira defluvii TaxID=330214 RepID=A0ABM8QZQ8_9BACT|nr:restriction endonuclease subunit S [Nitrospira defluvii]MCS6328840.1 restriction endonuclease subunit S [Nitrospira sp.]CAE6724784.1 Type I restriction-modification system, specificity subunit S [Nitrospira defluvii]